MSLKRRVKPKEWLQNDHTGAHRSPLGLGRVKTLCGARVAPLGAVASTLDFPNLAAVSAFPFCVLDSIAWRVT